MNPKTEKLASWIKWVAVLGVLAVAAPAIWLAVKGLVGLVIAAVVSVIAIEFAPVVSMFLAAKALKTFTAIVRKNPVEARLKVESDREKKINKASEKIAIFAGKVKSYEGEIESLCRNYPDESLKFKTHLAGMQRLLQLKYQRLEDASVALKQYRKETQKVRSIWSISQSAAAVSEAAGDLEGQDIYERIASEESVRAADESMANSFAALTHALEMQDIANASVEPTPLPIAQRVDAPLQIEDAVLSIPTVQITDKIGVPRK